MSFAQVNFNPAKAAALVLCGTSSGFSAEGMQLRRKSPMTQNKLEALKGQSNVTEAVSDKVLAIIDSDNEDSEDSDLDFYLSFADLVTDKFKKPDEKWLNGGADKAFTKYSHHMLPNKLPNPNGPRVLFSAEHMWVRPSGMEESQYLRPNDSKYISASTNYTVSKSKALKLREDQDYCERSLANVETTGKTKKLADNAQLVIILPDEGELFSRGPFSYDFEEVLFTQKSCFLQLTSKRARNVTVSVNGDQKVVVDMHLLKQVPDKTCQHKQEK